MMEDVEAIVAKLTKAQRKAIVTAEKHPTGAWRCPYVMFPADRNLKAKGLANGLWVELTPLGLAVRTYLLSQTKE
jgi:hypothetical protein